MRFPRSRYLLASFALLFAFGASSAVEAQLWTRFAPTSRVDAAPSADYMLEKTSGPWLVMAASFTGEGAKAQAHALVLELRQDYNLPAFLHEMAFQYSNDSADKSAGGYGGAPRKRYRREGENQYAVLVGEFPRIDDPEAQKTLDRVKQMQPKALRVEDGGKTAQALVQVRMFQDAVMSKLGVERHRGPMGAAFLARNPLLPDEYFVPKGVDDFVVKMNEGVEHSLLDCAGKFTVRVATFRGRSILQTSATSEDAPFGKSSGSKGADVLAEAAEKAHLLTEELRDSGWEAYEFHDRMESIVTIGSFAEVAQQMPDGRVVAVPAVQRILETFGAEYDTPADPLNDLGNDPLMQSRVDLKESEFAQRMGQQRAQLAAGLNPKHVKILRRKGGKLRTERVIPMDIRPEAIEVPQRYISSAYAR